MAKLVEYGRLELSVSLRARMEEALRLQGVQLIELTPRIAIESTQLPGTFHSDPADQIIVATARVYEIALATEDGKNKKLRACTRHLSGRRAPAGEPSLEAAAPGPARFADRCTLISVSA